MLDLIREFRVGRPQIFAGLLLLVFLAQCLWVSASRRFSDLEYQYIASGFRSKPGMEFRVTSPFTGIAAAFPLRVISAVRGILPARIKAALAVPHPWLARLPFVIFGMWLGGAIWWVSRRLFGDGGGYVALALYCFSPAMVMISSNIGPEIILAWSGFGLIYTAIGAAHTVYAPPRKWIHRIVMLGIAMGVYSFTTFSSFTTVLLFALVPAIYLWDATLALSFAFTFIGGIAADLLERPSRLLAGWVLAAIITIRAVLGLSLLNGWVHQNLL